MGEQQRAAQPASMAQQVTQSYLQNLGRAPETEGFNNWMQSGLTGPQINAAVQAAPEAYQVNPTQANAQNYIKGLYQNALGRQADQQGIDYWTNQLQGGQTIGQVQQDFQSSPEFQVRQAYKDILGRTPETEGAAYWQGQMNKGMTAADMRKAIQESSEAKSKTKTQAKRIGGIAALRSA